MNLNFKTRFGDMDDMYRSVPSGEIAISWGTHIFYCQLKIKYNY